MALATLEAGHIVHCALCSVQCAAMMRLSGRHWMRTVYGSIGSLILRWKQEQVRYGCIRMCVVVLRG